MLQKIRPKHPTSAVVRQKMDAKLKECKKKVQELSVKVDDLHKKRQFQEKEVKNIEYSLTKFCLWAGTPGWEVKIILTLNVFDFDFKIILKFHLDIFFLNLLKYYSNYSHNFLKNFLNLQIYILQLIKEIWNIGLSFPENWHHA